MVKIAVFCAYRQFHEGTKDKTTLTASPFTGGSPVHAIPVSEFQFSQGSVAYEKSETVSNSPDGCQGGDKVVGSLHIFSTSPLTFSLIVSMLSRPSLSTTFTAIVCTPALKV